MNSYVPLVADFMNRLGGGTVASTRELLHEEVTLDFPGVRPTQGRSQTVLMLRQIFFGFKTVKFTIVDVIEQNDKICAIWENTGEQKDGSAFANRGVTIFQVRDGAIASISDYFKHQASN